MTSLLPPEFLFRYTFVAKQITGLPRRGKKLLNLPSECALPKLAGLSGRPHFGEVRVAWNERGLGIGVHIDGKTHRPVSDPEKLGETDGLRLWIDTRCTQNMHRAGRFCHQFQLLPIGGGDDGMQPVAALWPIARAGEDPPEYDSDLLPVQSEIGSQGYTLEAWLPADALHGFDPDSQSRLGFFYALSDAELGLQTLSVGPEFPYASDPSVWGVLNLASA